MKVLALLPVLVVAAGCGTTGHKEGKGSDCRRGDRGFHLCGYPTQPHEQSRIARGGPAPVVIGPLEGGSKRPRGFWRTVHVSPDGKTLLATWSGECEIQIAFFVPAVSGARPRPVTGEADWRKAPESIGLGWTRGGLARVRLPKGSCGQRAREPGVYLVDPRTGAVRGPVG